MASPGGRPWGGKDLKAPLALALAVLALAAWKASQLKGVREEERRAGAPSGNTAGRSAPLSSSSGGVSSKGSSKGRGTGTSVSAGNGVGDKCRCDCHCSGHGRWVGSTAAASTTTSGGGHASGTRRRGKCAGEVRANNSGGGTAAVATGTRTSPPPPRCCNCAAATAAAAAAATALGRRAAANGGTTKAQAAAGTPRRGRNDRFASAEHSNSGDGRRRSRTREGSGGGPAGADSAAASGGTAGGSTVRVPGKRGSAGGVAAANAAAGESAAAAEAARGSMLVSAVSLRRMCHLPGAILRSGLVFQRVTALSLPRQGLGDGDIPASVARLAGGLRSVDVSGNRLTVVPAGLLELGGALEELDLGNNEIAEMPPEISNLTGLLFFNMAGNRLTRLPAEVGKLSALRRLGLKGNALVRLPPSIGNLTHLVELYLTGNILEALPNEIVNLRRLRKLQLSFNNLRSLPPGMEGLRSLELCRLAVNPGLAVVPEGLAFAERLSWISLAGSGWCARAADKRRRSSWPVIPREEVVLGERLGSGASGEVYAGVYRRQDVAVKVFKSDVGPDGNARDELDVACSVDHPNLSKALGVVRATSAATAAAASSSRSAASGERGGPGSATAAAAAVAGAAADGNNGCSIYKRQWLVMERVAGQPLADKPDFSSVLRCRWGAGRRFEPVLVLAVLLQVARAMSYLHEKGICHGDLYAHNVLVDGQTGAAVLYDFGASFFYPSERHDHGFVLEGTEVRAFGLMARDMARRSAGCEWILQDLVPSCLQSDAGHRPSFHEIINQLHAELMQSVEPSSPMVTSAKSLHSLLDRPDIAAERGRLLSAERRQEPSSSRSVESAISGCLNSTDTNSSTVCGGGDRSGVMGGVMTHAGVGVGVGKIGRPVWRLGDVQEGTADDEGGEGGDDGAEVRGTTGEGAATGGGDAVVSVE